MKWFFSNNYNCHSIYQCRESLGFSFYLAPWALFLCSYKSSEIYFVSSCASNLGGTKFEKLGIVRTPMSVVVLKAGGREVEIKETKYFKSLDWQLSEHDRQAEQFCLFAWKDSCLRGFDLVPNFAKILKSCEINGVMGSFTIVHNMRILECHFSQISFSICVGNRNKISVKLSMVEATQSKSPLKLLAQPQPAAPSPLFCCSSLNDIYLHRNCSLKVSRA
jgi:hypothetical protein